MASKIILLGADHAGFELKEAIKAHLAEKGIDVRDLTPEKIQGDDYPPIAKEAAEEVVKTDGQAILVCGSGMGMDIAANRIEGARAVVVRDEEEAKLSRQDDHANILVLGGRVTPAEKAITITDTWLATPYSKAKRHERRVKELDQP